MGIAVFFRLLNQSQGLEDDQEQEKGGDYMDCNIDEVVSYNIVPSKIIIEGETEAGYGTVWDISESLVGKERLFNRFPIEIRHLYVRIPGDVWFVVKMPGIVKAVAVNQEDHHGEGENGK
ncbi:MAG: hypothetical protein JRJ09_11185 [Deltaproteobacteria bacterium]|nr:hypothetical protein [Deltaproteobacteria bacterium]